ncbi:spheroidene monooxygenase [Thalassococcus sp. CAU 1522]|uniref:Spheroidene monooxygenase n=1 Tax=Thalassococcus arenae TaxID=2851652 RepID=A0ABS6N5V0_9RHOB|nr:spheroidene monooxygenase [Thalassococcus arenae]MBV2359396.1 spheroidene monooxygenase [Thalassococcus arenae]
MQTASLSLFRFESWVARVWALAMMGAARFRLPQVDGLGFWKLCGSGTGEGFTPIPNTAVYAILCTWPDLDTGRARIADDPLFAAYRKRAVEDWTVFLTPISSRGAWSGQTPFDAQSDNGTGPIAALTRATIKPSVALRFWRRVPDISQVIGADPSVLFKIGIGEVPLLHQVTFSVWPDDSSMAHFARRDGPHARAIRAVRDGNWFSEELYARFRVAGETGSWDGQSPRILKEAFA